MARDARCGAEPAIRRFTKPIWVSLRVRLLLSWLPGAALQWLRYLVYYGKLLPLRNPQTFTQRLLVKMARDRNPLLTRTADRVALRGFVEERIGPGHLPPLLAVLEQPEDLMGLDLPSRYVVKATHGSQMVHIVQQDGAAERAQIVRRARRWLRTEYWRRHGEWPYRHVPKRLIVEGYLGNTAEAPPPDWKWHCIGGQAVLVSVDFDRLTRHRRNFYDPEGTQLDLALNHRFGPGDLGPAPASFQAMRETAEQLAAGFEFVRVDLYDMPEGIIVGELTHCPAAGLLVFDPPSWDQRLGDLWGASLGEPVPSQRG